MKRVSQRLKKLSRDAAAAATAIAATTTDDFDSPADPTKTIAAIEGREVEVATTGSGNKSGSSAGGNSPAFLGRSEDGYSQNTFVMAAASPTASPAGADSSESGSST
jgi:hypothetical protein